MKLWNSFQQRRSTRRELFSQIEGHLETIKELLQKKSTVYLGDNKTLQVVAKHETESSAKVDLYDCVVDEWNVLDYFFDGEEVRQQLRYIKVSMRGIQHLKYDFMSGS